MQRKKRRAELPTRCPVQRLNENGVTSLFQNAQKSSSRAPLFFAPRHASPFSSCQGSGAASIERPRVIVRLGTMFVVSSISSSCRASISANCFLPRAMLSSNESGIGAIGDGGGKGESPYVGGSAGGGSGGGGGGGDGGM